MEEIFSQLKIIYYDSEHTARYLVDLSYRRKRRPKLVFYLNTHTLRLLHKDRALQQRYRCADAIYIDGWGAVLLAKLAGFPVKQRTTAMDFIYMFCSLAQKKRTRIFLFGGPKGVAERAGQKLCSLYPGLQIIGNEDGFSGESKEIVKRINKHKTDILLVGMGTPKQESWLVKNKLELRIQEGWAVGSLFEYIAKDKPRSPTWLGNYYMEWLFRFLQEPGLRKRYLHEARWLLKESLALLAKHKIFKEIS